VWEFFNPPQTPILEAPSRRHHGSGCRDASGNARARWASITECCRGPCAPCSRNGVTGSQSPAPSRGIHQDILREQLGLPLIGARRGRPDLAEEHIERVINRPQLFQPQRITAESAMHSLKLCRPSCGWHLWPCSAPAGAQVAQSLSHAGKRMTVNAIVRRHDRGAAAEMPISNPFRVGSQVNNRMIIGRLSRRVHSVAVKTWMLRECGGRKPKPYALEGAPEWAGEP